MELPQEVVFKDSIIEIIGKENIFIENYIRIMKFEDDNIVVQCKKYKLDIKGKSIEIKRYNKTQIEVTGYIDEIKFS